MEMELRDGYLTPDTEKLYNLGSPPRMDYFYLTLEHEDDPVPDSLANEYDEVERHPMWHVLLRRKDADA